MNAGLCQTCRHQKVVRTARGSVFSLCRRADSDPRYRKYPSLPVRTCSGYEETTDPQKERGIGKR